MNSDIKAKWVAKLRSGEYQQGYECLRMQDKYCVLGVLCDLHAQEVSNEWNKNLFCDTSYYNYNMYSLHTIVKEWAGLELGTEIIYEGVLSNLPALNDGLKLSFNELADIIEEQL